MITTGFSLAILSATGFYLIYRKLPNRIRKFMCKHVLITDSIVCLLTYMLFGGTIVALFAAAFMGIITSIMLVLINNPSTNALLERLATKCNEVKIKFAEWAENNIQQKEKKEVENN